MIRTSFVGPPAPGASIAGALAGAALVVAMGLASAPPTGAQNGTPGNPVDDKGELAQRLLEWRLHPVSATEKITARQPGQLLPYRHEPVQLTAVRGEWVHFQCVATAGPTPIDSLRWSTNGLATVLADTLAPSEIQIYRENYVAIRRPSGNKVLEPLYWPDALIPWELAPGTIPANSAAVYWVRIRIPRGTVPGVYFGELEATAGSPDGVTRRLAMAITVVDQEMPASTLRANAALYYDILRQWYEKNTAVRFSPEEWALQKRRYYDFLLDYGINAYDLPVSWDAPEATAYLRDPRVHSVRFPALDHADWDKAVSALRQAGSERKAYYYWNDEPQPDAYAKVKADAARLKPLGFPQCITLHPNAALEEAAAIWCPNIGDFFGIGHVDVDELARQRQRGRETWLYTMVEPRYPYPTWLVDDAGDAIGRYAPLMARYGLNGFVYSMVHGWGPKPLEDITSFAGTSGDGTLLYPGELVGAAGPLPSLRLMLLKDAMEDYELMVAARARLGGARLGGAHLPAYTRQAALAVLSNTHAAGSGSETTPDIAPFLSRPRHDWLLAARAPQGTQVAPVIDGKLDDGCWNERSRLSKQFTRAPGRPEAASGTRCWVTRQGDWLYVALKAHNPVGAEWLAVEVAPQDIQSTQERLRFVITLKGSVRAERATREGLYSVEVPGLKIARTEGPNSWAAEFRIPVSPLGYGRTLRFNALRRTGIAATGTRFTLRAWGDYSDPWRMPLLALPE